MVSEMAIGLGGVRMPAEMSWETRRRPVVLADWGYSGREVQRRCVQRNQSCWNHGQSPPMTRVVESSLHESGARPEMD